MSQALQEATENLISVVNQPPDAVSWSELNAAASAVFNASTTVDNDARNYAINQLTPSIASASTGRAAMVAITCGAMVESGANPALAIPAIVARLPEVINGAGAFMEACRALAANPDEDYIDAHRTEVAQANPEAARAYDSLDIFYRPAVAMLSRVAAARKEARANTALMDSLRQFPADHMAVDWLRQLLSVLDDEQLVVLHPEAKRGYRIVISGIAGNQQLYTLLEDALIGDPDEGWLSGTRPDPQVVEDAKRDTQLDVTTTGAFNLSNWGAIQSDGTFLDGAAGMAHWIWIEGVPADIAPFEGVRVVLLSKPPYSRSWNMVPPFSALEAQVNVIEKLDADATQAWINKLASAQRKPN